MSEFNIDLVSRIEVEPGMCDELGAVDKRPHQVTSYCPCFTPGTLIKTFLGECPVEEVTEGMLVLTRDNGYQPVKWVGTRTLDQATLKSVPALNPIRIKQGALGPDLPERDTVISPQHRMLLSNRQVSGCFETDEVLVAAHLLTCFEGVTREIVNEITYVHFMFEQHEIVLADGAWSESYQPTDMRIGVMDEMHRQELLSIFPALAENTHMKYPAARASIDAAQMAAAMSQEIIARHSAHASGVSRSSTARLS